MKININQMMDALLDGLNVEVCINGEYYEFEPTGTEELAMGSIRWECYDTLIKENNVEYQLQVARKERAKKLENRGHYYVAENY